MLKSLLITSAKILLIFSLLGFINLGYASQPCSPECLTRDCYGNPYMTGDVFQYRPPCYFHHHCGCVIHRPLPPRIVTNGHYRMTVVVYPGSLRANVTRIAKIYGWRSVVWDTTNDFRFVGGVRIRANSIEGVMAKLLKNYPLQAVFYRGNRVILIKPRALA